MRTCARQLHEVKLYEVSMTPFPASNQAQVTAVKDSRDAVVQFCRVMAQCAKQIRGRGINCLLRTLSRQGMDVSVVQELLL